MRAFNDKVTAADPRVVTVLLPDRRRGDRGSAALSAAADLAGADPAANRRRLILLICCLQASSMTWLDKRDRERRAPPPSACSLGASVAGLQWTVDAYLVTLASLLLCLAGR